MPRNIYLRREEAIDLVLDEEQCPACRRHAKNLILKSTWDNVPNWVEEKAEEIGEARNHKDPPEDRPVYHASYGEDIRRYYNSRLDQLQPYFKKHGSKKEQAAFRYDPVYKQGVGWEGGPSVNECQRNVHYAKEHIPWKRDKYVAILPNGRWSRKRLDTALEACEYSKQFKERWHRWTAEEQESVDTLEGPEELVSQGDLVSDPDGIDRSMK